MLFGKLVEAKWHAMIFAHQKSWKHKTLKWLKERKYINCEVRTLAYYSIWEPHKHYSILIHYKQFLVEDVKPLFTFIVVDLRWLETRNWDLKSIDGTTAVHHLVVAPTTVAAYLPKIFEILVLWSHFDYLIFFEILYWFFECI